MIARKTATVPACYGVACASRGQCQRYHAVERTPEHLAMMWCGEFAADSRPDFSPADKAPAALEGLACA